MADDRPVDPTEEQRKALSGPPKNKPIRLKRVEKHTKSNKLASIDFGSGSLLEPTRLAEVERRINNFESHARIKADLSRAWGCSPEAIRTYIDRVYQLWAEDWAPAKAIAQEYMLHRFAALYQYCIEEGEAPTAAACLDRMAKLFGAYAPDKVDVQHSGIGIDATDPEKIRARIAELQAKLLPSSVK